MSDPLKNSTPIIIIEVLLVKLEIRSVYTFPNRLMKHHIVPTLLLFLFCFGDSSFLSAQELQPHHVIIQSSFKEKSSIPEIRQHTFDLRSPNNAHEAYIPEFAFSDYQLPEDFPQNVRISGLTGLFGELSELFLGDNGILENGVRYYRTGEIDKAEEKFLSILPSTSIAGETATLWLAWVKYNKKKWDDCLIYTKTLHQSSNKRLRLEAYYLSSLVMIQKKEFKKQYALMQQYDDQNSISERDFRLNYATLIALTNLGYLNDAQLLLESIDHQTLSHAPLYYKMNEISGLVYFQLKLYQKSLDAYLKAVELNPKLSYKASIYRNIAWLNYFLKKYPKVVQTIDHHLSGPLLTMDNELKYLKLASLSHQNDWTSVNQLFLQLPKKSKFYGYSAFKIHTLLQDAHNFPKLKKQVSLLKYNFPKMKFYSALKTGNQAFKAERFKEAEKWYLRALSVDTNDRDYFTVQYNLSLCHLKQQDYQKAAKDFSELLHTSPENQTHWISYHLLFALYQLERSKEFIKHYEALSINTFEKSLVWEIQLMYGGILLSLNQNSKAAEVFLNIWKKTGQVLSLEFAVLTLFQDKNFKKIISLIQTSPQAKSDILYSYEIRSLLGARQFKKALQQLNKRDLTSEPFIQVGLEVWLANRLYDQIIDRVSKQLNKELQTETRLLYYLSLGDANFNLKKFPESKNQFYKALKLTKDPVKRSMILYNIALITFYSKDYPAFIKETQSVLQEDTLSKEIRYNLTQLLVSYYQQNQQLDKADITLEHYIKHYTYQKPKAKLKRIQLLYQAGNFDICYKLAEKQTKNESSLQRRDRIILAGYCGNPSGQEETIIHMIKKELKTEIKDYRENELEFLLAQAFYNTKQYKQSLKIAKKLNRQKLDKTAKFEVRLLLSNNHLHLKQLNQAIDELGEMNQYRQTVHYTKALRTLAEINLAQKKTNESVRVLLRIYYLPNVKPIEKQDTLLKIVEILTQQKLTTKATDYFEKIDREEVLKSDHLRPRYLKLQKTLSEAVPPKTSFIWLDSIPVKPAYTEENGIFISFLKKGRRCFT